MNRLFQKELILVAMAGTIAVMGLGFIIPLFPIYVSEKGASNFQLGLIVSGFTISQFLVQPFFGGLSDRFGRKPFMVGGMACYGLVASLYILADSLSQVFLVRLLHGVGAGMIWPALSAYVVDQSPVERRGETIGLLSGVEMVGFAVGPFLGGMLYSLGGMNLPFFGCAALALLPYGYYEPQLISYQGVRDAAQQAFNEIMQGADIQATLDVLTQTANDLQAELMEE